MSLLAGVAPGLPFCLLTVAYPARRQFFLGTNSSAIRLRSSSVYTRHPLTLRRAFGILPRFSASRSHRSEQPICLAAFATVVVSILSANLLPSVVIPMLYLRRCHVCQEMPKRCRENGEELLSIEVRQWVQESLATV